MMYKMGFAVKKNDVRVKERKKLTLRQKIIIALGAVLCVAIIILATAYGVFVHYYNKMNITDIEKDSKIVTAVDYEEGDINDNELTDEERQQLENLYNENNEKTDEPVENDDIQESIKFDEKNVTNILLVGTDSRKKGVKRSRTDTMVILSIDKNNKRMTMTSILRDTYVKIPGVGKNRLNAAFVFGGPKLLFKTIDENFGIKIDRYVQIDFYNFVALVDAVGGVDLPLTPAEIKVMNKTYIPYINKSLKAGSNIIKVNKSGKYHLNGVQALAYSRVRYVGSDFARTERQRNVMGQIIKKTKTLSVSELNSMADIVLPMVSTNLTQGEVMSLLVNAKEYLNYKIVNGRMPIDGSYKYMKIRGASVLGVNFDKNKRYWYNLVYGK